MAKIFTEKLRLLGGDRNAHIGCKEKVPAKGGRFGLKTHTNEAGPELSAWCVTLGFQCANSFQAVKNRDFLVQQKDNMRWTYS